MSKSLDIQVKDYKTTNGQEVRPRTSGIIKMGELALDDRLSFSHEEPSSRVPDSSLKANQPETPLHEPMMDDLYAVGPDKPMGYLPIKTITEMCGEEIEEVIDLCKQKGLSTMLLGKRKSKIPGGALYVYDEKALNHLLNEYEAVLRSHRWPLDASSFVRKSACKHASSPELYRLVAWAFRDPRPEYQRSI